MLTAIKVKKAAIKEKPYKLSDANGLYLWVHPNGSKYWRYKYRYYGKENVYSIGTARDVSLAQARKQHQEARELLNQGIDPNEHKKAAKLQRQLAADYSFQKIAEQWHEARRSKWDESMPQNYGEALSFTLFLILVVSPLAKLNRVLFWGPYVN